MALDLDSINDVPFTQNWRGFTRNEGDDTVVTSVSTWDQDDFNTWKIQNLNATHVGFINTYLTEEQALKDQAVADGDLVRDDDGNETWVSLDAMQVFLETKTSTPAGMAFHKIMYQYAVDKGLV